MVFSLLNNSSIDFQAKRFAKATGIGIAAWALLIFALPVHGFSLQNLTIEGDEKATQITISFDEKMSYDAFTIPKPPRLVVDVPSLKSASLAKGKMGGLVQNTRIGVHGQVANRFVFDLSEQVTVSKPVFRIEDGKHVLAIKLQEASGTPFRQQAFNHRDQAFVAKQAALKPRQKPSATATNFAVDPRAKASFWHRPAVTRSARTQNQGLGLRGSSRKPVVIIDPGHGGKDPGASSVSGIKEKDLTLTFGVELASILLQSGQYQVYLTRNTDVYIPLRERTRLASGVSGDLFISIHADSNTAASARGASFYTLSEESSDEEARRFAERENEAFAGSLDPYAQQRGNVKSILHNMALRETMALSRMFADQLTKKVSPIWPTRKRPHRQAGFAVLKSPDMPAVLLEMGYLSNKLDEHIMLVPQYRMTLANGIKESIDSYFRLIESDTAAK